MAQPRVTTGQDQALDQHTSGSQNVTVSRSTAADGQDRVLDQQALILFQDPNLLNKLNEHLNVVKTSLA